MTLLWFCLKVDQNDPVLAFAVDWIGRMAAKADRILVLTMEKGEYDLPANVTVHSVGKERGFSECRRAFEFYRLLFRILRDEKIDAVFAHMMPLFAGMAGPILRVKRIPLFLWYCHKSVTLVLRAAVFFSYKIFTCSENGMNVRSRKKRVIGHGIDLGKFLFSESGHEPHTLLCAGRVSPVKNVHVLIDVMDDLVHHSGLGDLKLLVGGGPTELKRDQRYWKTIRRRVSEKNLNDHILFLGKQSGDEMIKLY